jgi:glutaconyl-CoA/methylmalonyl-CoA decarboxylase subunit gamma
MKSYKISVNGTSYDVTVEELGAAPQYAPAPRAPAPVAGEAPAPAPAAAAAPAAPAAAAPVAGAHVVKSPMPGTLLSFKVAQGQAVRKGDVLFILEAMKMENEIVAPVDGVVAALRVSEGASVNTGDVLVELS